MNSISFKYLRRECAYSRYCCVPFCKISSRFNSVISFHKLPLDRATRKMWLHNIRRKTFEVSPHVRVCSRHFTNDDFIEPSYPTARRLLKKGAVPTLFRWNNDSTSGQKRFRLWEKKASSSSDQEEELVPMDFQHEDHNYYCTSRVQNDEVVDPTDDLRNEVEVLKRKVAEFSVNQRFCLGRFAASDDDIRFYTRFATYNHLMAFWRIIQPASHNMFRVTRARADTTKCDVQATDKASVQFLLPIDEFFLFMVHLSVGLTKRDLAHRFNVHQSTVSQIISTWANFLYTILGSVHIWMSKEAVKAQMPKEFQDYPDTQVIIDCIELCCRIQSSDLFPDEGYDCTFKGLIGMAPHGAVTFVSSLYAGSVSDNEVLKKSGIVLYLKPEMAIMVNKDFLVDDSVLCRVYRPAYPVKRELMEADEDVGKMGDTQSIAQLRVHIEHLICRVKQHKLLDSVMPFTSTRTINRLYIVACLFINYQDGPLLKRWT
nr:uncharacterized protein si:ch211-262i1.5 isoform X1 [Danio rerio]|eukprot:XP_695963.3 uncharacterized protein si:ch211-262i1.5 isoform X1 [Danio rerio]